MIFSVSNPIREYLQIDLFGGKVIEKTGFKPYKGVSSNNVLRDLLNHASMFQTL